MTMLGNENVNKIFEANVPADVPRINPDSERFFCLLTTAQNRHYTIYTKEKNIVYI